MDDLQRLLAERACERLVKKYVELIDFNMASQVADLFVPDGIWQSDKSRKVGVERIRSDFGIRQRRTLQVSRHVCTNISINVMSETEAVGVTYFTLYRNNRADPKSKFASLSGPEMMGEYRDRFILTEAGWRFASRHVQTAFVKEKPRLKKTQ